MPNLREGDRVVRADRHSDSYLDEKNGVVDGVVYIITSSGGNGLVGFRREDGVTQDKSECCAYRFKPAPASAETVVCVDNAEGSFNLTIGKRYDVVRRHNTGVYNQISVVDDKGETQSYLERRFGALPVAVKETVTCVETDTYLSLTVGKDYDVLDRETRGIRIVNDRGQTQIYLEKRFKNKETETMSNTAPKKGDEVLIRATVTRGPDQDSDYAVRCAGKSADIFVPASAIAQITKVARIEPTFKVGDKVRMIYTSANDTAKRGVVLAIHEASKTYFVDWTGGFSDNQPGTVKEKSLRSV